MTIFDLLSKEGRKRSTMERSLKRAADKNAQWEAREAALHKLREIGTEEALYGLARRFSITYDKTIQDEKEKEWVADVLTDAGDRAIGPLRRWLLESASVSYGLRVLGRIAQPEQIWPILDEMFAKEEPGYTRDPDKKIQLLTWISEWREARPADVVKRAIPYLTDFDETVRFTAVETIAHQKHQSALDPLVAALTNPEEESRRIKMRIADLLADAGWVLPPARKEAVAKLLGGELPEFGMHHDKLLKKGK
jgi:HEAT repeat protein